MKKDEASKLLETHVHADSLRDHCIATGRSDEGSCRGARGGCRELWEVIGILHDIDFEEIHEDMTQHGVAGHAILKNAGLSDAVADPVRRHNHMLFGGEYTTPVEICLQVADSVSGLVVACAYVKGGKITEVTPTTVPKKYKAGSFATGCDRNRIALGDGFVEREQMYAIAIREITLVKDQLGLA